MENGTEQIGAPLLYASDYSKIYIDEEDAVWGVSCYGVNRFDGPARRFTPWIKNGRAVQGPNLHLHSCYCTDAAGNIWQGDDRTGLVEYDLHRRQVTDQ